MSSLRESFERASLPALTFLSGLPRFVPFLVILGLVVAGLFVPWGWVLIALVVLILTWIAVLAWPRLTPAERLMRLAVIALMAAIAVTQAFPRG